MPLHAASTATSPNAIGELPQRLKVLFFSAPGGGGCWLAEAFAADGAAQIFLEETTDIPVGLTRLRDEVFDAILVMHAPASLDALGLVEAIRAGGSDEPLVILGSQPSQELDALAYEAGADDYCSLADTTVRGLLWKFTRAIERFTLTRENRRLIQAERQRLQHEHQEAERLLEQQRGLIDDLQELSQYSGSLSHVEMGPIEHGQVEVGRVPSGKPCAAAGERIAANQNNDINRTPFGRISFRLGLPTSLTDHYRELLRAYVIMGAGNLSHEMSELAHLLAASNITAQQTLQLHVEVLEELIQGLGNRSARHVMNRADLLALEVMGHLADRYRQRSVNSAQAA